MYMTEVINDQIIVDAHIHDNDNLKELIADMAKVLNAKSLKQSKKSGLFTESERIKKHIKKAIVYLSLLLCYMNGFEPKSALKDHDIPLSNPFADEFKEVSVLFNNITSRCLIDKESVLFRARHLTLLIGAIIPFYKKILSTYLTGVVPGSKKELELVDLYAKYIIDTVESYMTSNDYKFDNIISPLFAMENGVTGAKEYARENLKIIEQLDNRFLLLNHDPDIDISDLWTDRKLLSKIIKNAFAIATSTIDVVHVRISDDELDDDVVENAVLMLGDAFKAYIKKHNASTVYRAWALAHPYVKTKYQNVQSPKGLAYGCRVLQFYAHMTNDEHLTGYINMIINK